MSGWQALAYFSMQLLVLSTSQPALSQAYRQDKQTNSWRGEEKRRSRISTNLIAYSVSELTNHYLDLPSETSFDENIKCILIH